MQRAYRGVGRTGGPSGILGLASLATGAVVAGLTVLGCAGSAPDGSLTAGAGAAPPAPPCPAGRICPPEQETSHYFEQNINGDVDIVFMVDNSSSMIQLQQDLTASFPAFVNALKALPSGLPNLHIGVVSSSLGAGRFQDVPSCPSNGDRGAFQNLPRGKYGACTAVPTDHYIVSLDKGTKNNFQGDITDVFSCIAELGADGCGFEHQLAASARALGGNLGGWKGGAPSENANFLRDGAFLALVMVTNEDDCSGPVDSDLYDTTQNSISDPLGPLNSYRCNEFGHLCGGVKPPRTAAMNLQDCHSAEDAGKLIPVRDFVNFFKTVKEYPGRVHTAAIAAPAEPYTVVINGAGNPGIAHSCTSGAAFGDPAVRIKEFTDAFGTNGTFSSICESTFAPALDRIGKDIGRRVGTQCIDGVLKDRDTSQSGVQPECSVVDRTQTGNGSVNTPLPNCAVGAPPCWRLARNGVDCPVSDFEIVIDRGGGTAPANTVTWVRCATCTDNVSDGCRP